MNTQGPYPPPAPLVLAEMLAMHCWANHLDDHTRLLCEWAADAIRAGVLERHRLSQRAERLEGDNELLFQLHYGPQKGGAA